MASAELSLSPSPVRLLREELQLLQEQGSYVGEVVRAMDKKKVLVKVRGRAAPTGLTGLRDLPASPRGMGQLWGVGWELPVQRSSLRWLCRAWGCPGVSGGVGAAGCCSSQALWVSLSQESPGKRLRGVCSFPGAPRGEVRGGRGQEHRHQ